MTSIDFTNSAIDALRLQKFSDAQNLFQQSAEEHQDYISYHNLGVFYLEYGKTRKNGTACSASQDAYKNLCLSRREKHTSVNSFLLGKWFFDQKRFDKAAMLFRESYDLKKDYRSAYCCGAAAYLNGSPKDAISYYNLAETLCDDDFRAQIETALIYGYLEYDTDAAREAFDKYKMDLDLEDQFVLAYCVKDLTYAEAQIDALLSEYVLDSAALAMVYDCLLKSTDEAQANTRLLSHSDCFEGFPDARSRMRDVKKIISDRNACLELTKQFQYVPLLPVICGLLYCPQHGNQE
jgi:tetratricopeptide (TPR) repeat protein